jgi:hypothetical protein
MRYLLLLISLLPAWTACGRPPDSPGAYNRFFRNGECNPTAFALARRGYDILLAEGLLEAPRYLTIVDYTRPSNQQRLFVLDMAENRLLLSSITAHGVGSDPDSSTIPYRFSNKDGSKMTSLGFYLTGSIYTNFRPGDSLGLCLFGLDKGFNDSAANREIVLHYGATEYSGRVYVTDSGAARSYGCPALPLSTNGRIIQMIKGGSLLFIYSDKDPQYARQSTVLNGQISLPIRQQGPPPNNCSCNLEGRKRAR